MDLDMSSIPKPPKEGSKVGVVIKKIRLKIPPGLVELFADVCCNSQGSPDAKREETTSTQIHCNGDSEAHSVPGSTLPQRQIKSPPSPCKLEGCILANILPFEEKWSEKATVFFESVLDKQMSGLVEDVLMPNRILLLHIPFISSYLTQRLLAKKVGSGHFKSLVLSSLDSPERRASTPPCSSSPELSNGGCAQETPGQYLYLELQLNGFETVEVTQVTDPLSLFCKLTIFSQELRKISEQMQQHYSGRCVPGPGGPLARGSPCATRDTDGTWHRSLLTQGGMSGTSSVEVLHVDCGETRLIPTSDVQRLHENFLRIPVLTYHCTLSGVHATTWRKDHIDDLKSMLLCKNVVARFQSYDAVKNIYAVMLFDSDAECINAYFTENSGVLSDSRHAHKDSASDFTNLLGTEDVNKSSSTNMDMTNGFLLGSISSTPRNPPANGRTDNDIKCVDQKCWPNMSPVGRENANSVTPNGLLASPQSRAARKSPIHTQSLTQTQTPSQSADPLKTTSFPYSYSIQYLAIGSREKVYITCSVSVDHFYCQLSRNGHALNGIVEGIKQLLARLPQRAGLPLVVNAACIARYADNEWYRGRIKTTNPKLQVYFVDFGDVIPVKMSDVCPLLAECSVVQAFPAQAIEIGLFNVPADAPKEINEWFKENATYRQFTISVVKEDSSGKLLVELFDGTFNVNLAVKERMVRAKNNTGSQPQPVPSPSSSAESSTPEFPADHKKMQKQPQAAKPKRSAVQQHEVPNVKDLCVNVSDQKSRASVDAVQHVNHSVEQSGTTSQNATLADLPSRLLERGFSGAVHISHFDNPSRFFVQLQQNGNEIYAVSEKLNDHEGVYTSPVGFNGLNVGDLISAEAPDDGLWYRTVVGKKLDSETLTVQFIDFGNEATIPCVKTCYLNKECLAQPRFSIHCTFGAMCNDQEQWDPVAILAFRNSTLENPEKTYSCTFMEEYQNVWEVVLEDQGVVLAQTLIQIQETQTGPNLTQIGRTEEADRYTKPDIVPNGVYQVFATCIAGPHYFWCQHDNSAVLDELSLLVDQAGRSGEQDPTWLESLHRGSPCLTLFPGDNLWYRAQVVRRTADVFSVLFIDYGNEEEVDVSCVKALPRILFDTPPQAFLCTLEGFDQSKGVWEDSVFDEFYSLLVDKLLCVTPLKAEDNLDRAIPQYAMKVEVGEIMVNKAMESYWKGLGEMDGGRCPVQSPPSLVLPGSDEHEHQRKLLDTPTE